MNRLKIGLYTALVLLACAANAVLVPRWWVARELGRMDSGLRVAAAEVSARARTGGESPAEAAPARTASGADVTVRADGGSVSSTLAQGDAEAVLAAARSGAPASAGAMPPVTVRPELPPLPLLLVDAPAHRVLAVEPGGSQAARSAVSLPAAAALAPVVTFQWLALAALVILLLVGLVLAATATDEQRAVVPRQLVSVADRIARGDFSVRAPTMAGSLGSIAAALNTAAEAASAARTAPASDPFAPRPVTELRSLAVAEELPADEQAPAGEVPPPEPAASDPFAVPASGSPPVEPVTAELEAAERLPPVEPRPASEPVTAPFAPAQAATEPTQAAEPQGTAPYFFPPAAEAGGAPPAEERTVTTLLGDERALEAASPVAPAPAAAGQEVDAAASVQAAPATPADEQHWRAVYDDFVRARAECNEPGRISFERFRQQLMARREQIVARKACRTVRFQVQVKDAKVAIKASPVR